MASTYAKDGVNIDAGDELSSYAAKMSKMTWPHASVVTIRQPIVGFRGFRNYEMKPRFAERKCTWTMGADGIGTKVVLNDSIGTYVDSAMDLGTMLADDITRSGSVPACMFTVLDVRSTESQDLVRGLFDGYTRMAETLRIAVIAGETAELGACVGSENPNAKLMYNWAGGMIGLSHPSKIITGEHVAPGDIVVALREVAFRSNGISTVRKAFANKFGPEWWRQEAAHPYIIAAAKPSIPYSPFLARINGWYSRDFKRKIPIKFIAHITGGGIVSKFGNELLSKTGLSATLEDLWDPSDIMSNCVQWRGFESFDEVYKTVNGGQGCLVVLSGECVKDFILEAKRDGIDAKECGKIVERTRPTLSIRSKFFDQDWHHYPM